MRKDRKSGWLPGGGDDRTASAKRAEDNAHNLLILGEDPENAMVLALTDAPNGSRIGATIRKTESGVYVAFRAVFPED